MGTAACVVQPSIVLLLPVASALSSVAPGVAAAVEALLCETLRRRGEARTAPCGHLPGCDLAEVNAACPVVIMACIVNWSWHRVVACACGVPLPHAVV